VIAGPDTINAVPTQSPTKWRLSRRRTFKSRLAFHPKPTSVLGTETPEDGVPAGLRLQAGRPSPPCSRPVFSACDVTRATSDYRTTAFRSEETPDVVSNSTRRETAFSDRVGRIAGCHGWCCPFPDRQGPGPATPDPTAAAG